MSGFYWSFKIPEKVFARDNEEGKPTGGTRKCAMEGCTGLRVAVRWPKGNVTWPCTKGMKAYKYTNTMKII